MPAKPCSLKRTSASSRSASLRVGPGRRVLEDRLQQRARPRAVAGVDVVLGGAHPAHPRGARELVGRERPRLLEQVAGGLPRAARPRRGRGVLEPARHALVGLLGAEREVAHALLRVGDVVRQAAVQRAPAPARRRAVDGGGVERVREGDPIARDVEQPALLGGHEAGGRRRLLDDLDGRVPQGGGHQQRLARVMRQPGDPARHELAQAVGHRQAGARLERRRRAERAGDLEREQRVAAGRLGDLQQRRPREGVAELPLDQPPHGREPERAEPHAREVLRAERALEAERVGVIQRRPRRQDHADPVAGDSPQREGQRAGGLAVEPLHVVDREHDRRVGGREQQQRAQADADRGRVGRSVAGGAADQRDLERLALRGGQLVQVVVGKIVREVAEAREREPRLGLLGDDAQHAAAARLRVRQRRPPHRGLADAGLALDQQRARAVVEAVEQGARGGALLVALDEGGDRS